MNLLNNGLQWLSRMQKQHVSSEILYVRSDQSYKIDAGFGRTKYEIENDNGFKITAFTTDFLIAASDISLTPQDGDEIIAGGVTYEVMKLGGECWRWCDPHHITRRIHAKIVKYGE